MKKVVIVGGVAGGAAAAARLRRLDESLEIIMFEKDEYISFANCGLPYHIGDTIKERSKLIIQTPQEMGKRFNLDIRNFSEVMAVDTKNKTVTVLNDARGEYKESYDVLILSPGANPMAPPFDVKAPDRVFTLRNIPDTDKIKSFIEQEKVKSSVVIGGGFIGIEMVENLRDIGVEVTLVEAAGHVMPPFDDEMAMILEKELEENGVTVLTKEVVDSILSEDNHAVVKTKSGKKISAEIVISAVGVAPATGFLKGSGIALGPRGHIITDDCMLTNLPDIYAVGDAVSVKDFVTGETTAIPLAGPAAKQARIVADRICGIDRRYKGTQGTSVLKVFSLTAALTGISERTANKLGLSYTPIHTHPYSHATYYPGAVQMTCKLIFAEDGVILGCQIIGEKGAEKRIDVVATTMRLGGKVTDLCELELSYAPPYSTTKDPVNMLGFIAQNIMEGNGNYVPPHYIKARDSKKTILLDVRTPKEFKHGHVQGAINIPVDELRTRLHELDKDKEIIEYCQIGLRAHVAERILTNNGFKVKNVTGGYNSIVQKGGN